MRIFLPLPYLPRFHVGNSSFVSVGVKRRVLVQRGYIERRRADICATTRRKNILLQYLFIACAILYLHRPGRQIG